MPTYLVVFQYTADRNLYSINKVVTLSLPFSADDIETQEKLASEENKHKSRIVNIIPIEESRKPKKN